MISVQNFGEIPLDNATLSAQVLNHFLTAVDQISLTGLERLSAVIETDVRVTGEVRSALSDLLGNVMAWVSHRRRRKEERSRKGDDRRWEVDHLDKDLEDFG